MRPSTCVVERLRVTVVDLPTDGPEADGTLAWSRTTCVLVEADSEGCTGLGWTYAPRSCADLVLDALAGVVRGRPVMATDATWWAMVREVRNDTRPGLAGYAVSAVDAALWDLKARVLGVSLRDLLGGARDRVEVYGSGGFTTYDEARTVEQLRGWMAWGARGVKIKIGESDGSAEDRDLARMRLARDVLGPGPALMVDANGGYRRKQAVRLAHDAFPALGVTWFEEPVPSDDLDGLRLVRDSVDADVAAGEYGGDVVDVRRMCAANAVDCLQVDATRCGGVTGWRRATDVADAYGVDVSSHCAPHLHLHLAASTRHLRHMEYFHDHERLEQLVLVGTSPAVDGCLAVPDDVTGTGLSLRDDVEGAVAELGGTVARC